MRRTTAGLLTCAIAAAAANGCAAIPLAALGTAIGVGASAVSTGASVYSLGKLNSAELATPDQARHAVEAAAAELDLRTRPGGGYDEAGVDYTFKLADRQGAAVDVVVQERGARLVRLRIDVGLFGNEPTARLILERVRARLPLPTSRPAGAPA